MVVVFPFLGRGFDDFDRRAVDDVGELFVQLREGGGRRRGFKPDDEQILHKPAGLKIPVKAGDDFHRPVGVVGDVVKIQVIG